MSYVPVYGTYSNLGLDSLGMFMGFALRLFVCPELLPDVLSPVVDWFKKKLNSHSKPPGPRQKHR